MQNNQLMTKSHVESEDNSNEWGAQRQAGSFILYTVGGRLR